MTSGHRILYFSSLFPSPWNPHFGIFSLQRVLALQKVGNELSVICPVLLNPPPHIFTKPFQIFNWIKNQVQYPIKMQHQGITVHYEKWICPPKKIFGWYTSLFLFLEMRNRIIKIMREFNPEIILSSWLPDGVAATKFGEMLRIPTLCIADGSDINRWSQEYPAWSYARNILNEKASKIIFVSDALQAAGKLKGLDREKSVVLHNAVDTQLFKPNAAHTNGNPYTILGVGRFVPQKGFQILLEAFAKFSQAIEQPSRLILIGDGPSRSSLVKQTESLGISESVDFVKTVKFEELAAYYRAADVFCLPSFSEGFPCVVIEAMSCGKPVVATIVGGIPEVVDSNSGILVAPGNAKTLCEALIEAKKRVWDVKKIRQKIVDSFEWGKWASTIMWLMDAVSTG